MGSSTATATAFPASLFVRHFLVRHRLNNNAYLSLFRSKNPRRPPQHHLLRLAASATNTASWLSPPHSDHHYNGWALPEPPPPSPNKKGVYKIVICGAVAMVAAVAYFSISRKGWFSLEFGGPVISLVDSRVDKIEAPQSDENVADLIPEAPAEPISSVSEQKLEQVKVSVLVDSAQLEALSVLKKLKIIEDDVKADELCTRREYARWLIRINSLLERNPKHRITCLSGSGSVVFAFDDVNVEDPDFDSIQAIAEAGFTPSKISGTSYHSENPRDENFSFYPERFLSRQDLINWKAQLEYQFMPEITKQMSRTKVDYMDVKDISPDASPEFFVDLLAGDDSIIRKVFGQSRRFQPNKPLTKAQAAVALTSGRMSEAVHNEILRLEVENSSRQAALKEIRSELLDKGDIERFWVEKMNEERTRGLEVQKLYVTVLHELQQEKTVQVKTSAEFLKEKAAMDCQRQLLVNLKEAVDEMSERLSSERAIYVSEQCNLQALLCELQTKQEGMLDKKSVLEAEIEALRILRSWVEDEAKKSQARAKVLEEVGRRWKWDNQD